LETLSATEKFLSAEILAMSDVGTVSIICTSPLSNAATRAAELLRILNVILSQGSSPPQ
jgi:hypothetical protein